MEIPDIEYPRSGDLSIAYQVIGDGAIDIIFVRGFAGSGVDFADRGVQELKGVPGEWRLYAVVGG